MEDKYLDEFLNKRVQIIDPSLAGKTGIVRGGGSISWMGELKGPNPGMVYHIDLDEPITLENGRVMRTITLTRDQFELS